jgi:hypothetical protein
MLGLGCGDADAGGEPLGGSTPPALAANPARFGRILEFDPESCSGTEERRALVALPPARRAA